MVWRFWGSAGWGCSQREKLAKSPALPAHRPTTHVGLWNRSIELNCPRATGRGRVSAAHCYHLLSWGVRVSNGKAWTSSQRGRVLGFITLVAPQWASFTPSPQPCSLLALLATPCLCYRVTAPFLHGFPQNITFPYHSDLRSLSRYSWSPLRYSLAPYYPIFLLSAL